MDRPTWVSRSLFPFEAHSFESADGPMHYVDEGQGSAILMVHGTPTWSFLYRDLITSLSTDHRVIAVDHLGFGLSAKPGDAPYRPQDHARRLTDFVDHLGMDRFTLVAHDYGGPIGLSYALQRPTTVTRLVLFNTWLWSLRDRAAVRAMDVVTRGPLGRLFYRRFNGSPRVLLKAAWGDRTPLTDEVHRHYTNPFPTSADRTAPWVLARELIGSSEWYDSLWRRRSEITQLPTLLVWGLADPAFGESSLERWEEALSNATVRRLPGIGHFVPDEASARVTAEMADFLQDS